MNRSRTSLAVAVLAVAFLGACGGGDASQSDVQDKVEDLLTDPDGGYPGVPLDTADAAGAAACVAQGLFDPNRFSKDDRNDVSSAIDADVPSEQVIGDFETLVEECVDEATATPTQGPTVDEDDDTTTTERSTSED